MGQFIGVHTDSSWSIFRPNCSFELCAKKFNEQVILYSNADFIAPRASGPLVLVWSSHLASCWLCAHRTVTARMLRLTLHACLARYSQKPKFNSIIWGWEVSGHGEAQQLQPILFLQNSSNGRITSHC